MYKKIDKKLSLLIILFIGVGALSIGLAAFSNTLNIKPTTTVSPSRDNYKLELSCAKDSLDECELAPTSDNPELVEKSSKAIIDNTGEDLLIKNLNFYFTEPGQSVTYTFYVRNIGKSKIYLKSYCQRNIEGYDKSIKCTAGEGTSQKLVDQLCNGAGNFTLTYYIGGNGATGGGIGKFEHSIFSNTTINNTRVFITITYRETGVRVDGPVSIELGDYYAKFSTVPNA